ncbi:MAG: SDR family oxidoreductase [Gammaproteobacteria bacterium]|nr:SDR family oxidoreductase [Gammaproteobacteria bacterium]
MNKVLLITGASRGIGAETARLAAASGYSVCINFHHSETKAQQLLESIQSAGHKAIAVKADISDESEVGRLFTTVDSKLGTLSALVNNAGILERQSDFENISLARLQRVFRTNVEGSFLCAREAIKRMSTKHGGGGGSIVNLSSRAAVLGAAHEYVDYAASKGAIDSMTTGLAHELGDQGIRVNAVRPGLIYTDMHASGGEAARVDRLKAGVPMQRGGQAIEVARAILWLLSDQASYTTGTFIDVSGGR